MRSELRAASAADAELIPFSAAAVDATTTSVALGERGLRYLTQHDLWKHVADWLTETRSERLNLCCSLVVP